MDYTGKEFPMADKDFTILAAKAYDISGIVLGDHKKDLVYSRIARRIRKLAKEVIPQWKKMGRHHPIRIWSSACSTGPEPYSIAITLNKNMPVSQFDVKILATDLDSDVLKKARAGIYPVEDIEQLPRNYLSSFKRKKNSDMGQVKQGLRELIQFNRLNLLGPTSLM